ncbi:catalase [Floricoccus penangensis]|uniref:catalase n=1 Tax=Floricoccus penangensis TaxID=1859475 RepID=UPI00203A5827|nr:catalase [Floricoccus penangensis]URZ86521.1 catalase [Floricoccus penangensis]
MATYDENSFLTSAEGTPIGDNQHSLIAGENGPVLLQDYHLLEKLAHFSRERIPERVVHAKGAGAFGTFTLTHDMSEYTKTDIFNGQGKETEMFARFSTVAGESGSSDTARDPRGFALKFYTNEGNYDIVGLSFPVFFIRDAKKFPDFIHTQKRNPQTHLHSDRAKWDFWSLSPESLHMITMLFGDRGIPATYRNMNGFGTHTFMWVNAEGKRSWIKYHFKPKDGVKSLMSDLAQKLDGENPDSATQDLFNSIESGNYPEWTMYVQIIPFEEGWNYKQNIFDVTRTVSHKDYPLIEVGKFTLNQNPRNYFADVEEATFSPANLVPGIEASPDKMLQGRLFSYADAHRYRVGANSAHIPVNAPKTLVHNYQVDGVMGVNEHQSQINYEPNSFDGQKENPTAKERGYEVEGEIGHYVTYDNDFYSQPRALYNLISDDERERLIQNIADSLGNVEENEIKRRQVINFYKVDPDYGQRVANAIGLEIDFDKI